MDIKDIDTKKMTFDEGRHIIFVDLGFCGCGNPDIVLEFVKEALVRIKKRSDLDDWGWEGDDVRKHFRNGDDDLFFWMAWYFIDRSGLIEHGSSVSCSWLTDKGESFLEFLKEYSVEKILI